MKKGKSILTRCLALALALVLIVSSANLSAALKVSANSQSVEVSYGKLMADTYELADWEKELLSSGLLDLHFTYESAPTADDKVVTIDDGNSKIIAKAHNEWIPVSADIMVNNEAVETVPLTDGEGTYTYTGEEFSVAVKYELYANLKASTQQVILNSGVYLNEALDNLAVVSEQDGKLLIVEQALEMLMSIKDVSPNGELSFSDEFRAAVEALNAQKQNGGLELRNLIATYREGTAYMWENWNLYKETVAETYGYLNAINTDTLVQSGGIEEYLAAADYWDGTDNLSLWRTFTGTVEALVNALEPVVNDSWNVGQIFVITPGAELDALLKNVGTPSKVNFVEDLLVDTATVLATKNMQTLMVSVELKVVEDEVGSTELVSGGASKRVVLSVSQNASEEEIYAEIEKSGVVAQAQAAWGEAFVAEHYEATTVQSEVNGNIAVVITYAPKNYNLNCGFEDGETSVKVPYGYQYMLPVHENAGQYSYDYTVEGEAAMQGEVITITGNTNVTRTEGNAYKKTSVYAAIGSSLGNETAEAVLSSAALKGDRVIYYRTPNAPVLTLENGVLTAETAIASSYADLNWVPYSYNEILFQGNTASGVSGREAQVDYVLKLTNVAPAEAVKMLAAAKDIYAEAAVQTEGMDYLMTKYDDIGTLNKSYFGALLGTIQTFDFTPGDKTDTDAANLEMREYFGGIISAILNTKNPDGTAKYISGDGLTLYSMLTEYKNGGLAYYYKNSEAIYEQVSDLAGFLTDLVGDDEKEEALALLLTALNKGDLVEKIGNLGEAMSNTKANLLPTHEMIDTTADLKALVKAVSAEKAPETEAEGNPYILTGKYPVVDSSAVALIAKINVDGKEVKVITNTYDNGVVLNADMTNALLDAIWAEVENQLGDNFNYYTVDTAEARELDNLLGTALYENQTVVISANAKQYTVKIEGQGNQTITVNDLSIDLPVHENHPNTVYEYTVKGEVTRATVYSFTVEDLDTLFVNGSYTITAETLNIGQQKLNAAIEALTNETVGNTCEVVDGVMYVTIAGSPDGLMAFANGLLATGYGYIGINEHDLLCPDADGVPKVSIQALIDAILEDETFGSETLIALGNAGEGEVLNATLTLSDDKESVPYEEDMPIVLSLASVPEQMATVAKGLEAGRENLYFKSNGDHMYVYVNLPEKVYEVYLTAMWGIGELDKTDLNAINNQIALQFLYDYVELIANTDVTATTFENTLRIFDEAANAVLDKDIPDYDIAAYDKYLELVKKALNSEGLVVEADEETMTLGVTGQGKHIKTALEKAGVDISLYESMIKEFGEGETLSAKVIATLVNTAVDYEALVIDINAGIDGAKEIYHVDNRSEALNEAIDLGKGLGLANSIDYTTDLPTRASQITGKAAIMLLDDVDGDLVFNDTTILDLNGKTINGNLIANGHVYIMDSTLDTANAGSITGSVSGNVTIVAGNYNANVAAYLPDGYLQVNGNVRNAMYTIESPNSGDLIVTVNPDFYMEGYVNGYFPSAKALAADIATDLAFNYYLAAKLAVDGNTIYNMDLDNLIGFIESETRVSDFINQILTLVDTEGTSNVINTITADLLDFAAIEQALINGTEIVSYDVTVAPYGAELVHIVDGDYVSFNLGSMEGHERTFEIALKMEEGVNTDRLIKVVGELADIVVAENTYATVFVKQPTYSDRTLWLDGNTKASLDLDLSKNPDYQIIIAVALAYGNPDKAEALVNAIGDQTALKKVFNTITVEEVFNALKALEREVGFAAMAESLGVDEAVENAAAKERVVHLTLSSIGYVLEKLDITGYPDKTMGMIEEGDTGRYTVSRSAAKAGDVTRRGFTVDASAVVEHVTLSVKIFEDDCLWGDADHDGVVDQHDASLVLQYFLGNLDENEFFCTKRTDVDANGVIDQHDASLILEYFLGYIDKFPAEV